MWGAAEPEEKRSIFDKYKEGLSKQPALDKNFLQGSIYKPDVYEDRFAKGKGAEFA